ncbi:hypothetical protein [Hyphomonas beringensis]|nr:hypothetical protein [Hyphomonas beringensis]
MFKTFLAGLFFIAWPLSASAEWTPAAFVDKIEVDTDVDGLAIYYFHVQSGWGAASCPSATWARIQSDAIGSGAVLSLLMQARAMGVQVTVEGQCASPGFFTISKASML